MVDTKIIRFLLFVILMIFPAHALDVIVSRADGIFKQKSKINSYIENGAKIYGGTSNELVYRAENGTSKVIVYIIDRSRFVEIMRIAVGETRSQIAQQLIQYSCELLFLGIDNFDDDEYHLIGAFMLEKIQPHHPNETKFTIETIGEGHFDRSYHYPYFNQMLYVHRYQENALICSGALQAILRVFPRGALRPVENNGKEIRLYDYHLDVREVRWPVSMVCNSYFPDTNINDPKFNFKMRYPDKKICLLILSGREYSTATSYGERLPQETEVMRILDKMTNNHEVLLILGAFNFDWTEIDIVTQIIHRHSGGGSHPTDNVFTCGYGMFNTAYMLNPHENIGFPQQPKSNVSKLIKVLMGEEVKERAINMYFASYGWKIWSMPINLGNGQYMAEQEFKNYTFPWVDQKIAFIVYDSDELINPVDIRMVYQFMGELKQSGIYVVVIEAINFGLDDTHIIAEWIDYHRTVNIQNSNRREFKIDSEQIAVFGAGIFNTIFQSKSTTYKTLHNTKKDELKAIRDVYVKTHGKKVFAAQIDSPGFKVWTYPINTVNGYYEPDLIPDQNMFGIDGKKILFIITSAYRFHRISKKRDVDIGTQWLRNAIEPLYPHSEWRVFLVGLHHFEERDYHLFAELVERQTHDERSFRKFVSTFNYGIGFSSYQYKDNRPFTTVRHPLIQSHIESFFVSIR